MTHSFWFFWFVWVTFTVAFCFLKDSFSDSRVDQVGERVISLIVNWVVEISPFQFLFASFQSGHQYPFAGSLVWFLARRERFGLYVL